MRLPLTTAAQSQPSLECRIARGRAAATLLDERWDDLNLRGTLANPAVAACWLRQVVAYESGEPLLAAVEADGRLACAGAFRTRRLGALPRPRIARTLGIGLSTLSHAFLVDSDVNGAVPVLVARLLEEIDLLLIDCPSEDEILAELLHQAPWARVLPAIEGWQVSLPPPRLDYARTRRSYELRRAARLGATVAVSVAEEPDAVATAFERLLLLHQERWRDRRDFLGLFSATAAQRDFHRAAVRAAAEDGGVRVAEVVEDGELVGSSMVILSGRAALCNGIAVRAGGALREPGHVALLAAAEAATRAGAVRLDLGRGSGRPGSPKHRLGASEIPFVSVLAARSRPTQRLFEAAIGLRDVARRIAVRAAPRR